MPVSDPIADLLTRIRNGQSKNKRTILAPASKAKAAVLDVLKSEGYIRGYTRHDEESGRSNFEIELKYADGKPVITEVHRVSRPGRRIYFGVEDLPRVYNGLGISILSTPRGVMSDLEARRQNVGGELICTVF
jgi:small subunit ribosomal protein S8